MCLYKPFILIVSRPMERLIVVTLSFRTISVGPIEWQGIVTLWMPQIKCRDLRGLYYLLYFTLCLCTCSYIHEYVILLLYNCIDITKTTNDGFDVWSTVTCELVRISTSRRRDLGERENRTTTTQWHNQNKEDEYTRYSNYLTTGNIQELFLNNLS